MNAYVADCQIVECHHNLVRYENNRLPIGSLNFLPQDNAADVYHKVRLEAGALHLAKYLIRSAVYILSAKVDKIW